MKLAYKGANSLGLLDVIDTIRDYGVYEFNSLYIYLPLPRSEVDHDAWSWISTAKVLGVVRSGPWRVDAARRVASLRILNPKLCIRNPDFFEVYRMDEGKLRRILEPV